MKSAASFLLYCVAVLLVGCSSTPPDQTITNDATVAPKQIGWSRNEWRICEADACPAPTAKTVLLNVPRALPVVAPTPRAEKQGVVVAAARKPITVYFEFATATPTAIGKSAMDEIVAGILQDDSIHIEGHTDDLGTQRFNDRLARKRAEYIAARLTERGIKNPMEIVSHGKCCYVVPNDSEGARARNRRAEVRFVTKGSNP